MKSYRIKGGQKLTGSVLISGAKNAILPILAASLLTNQEIYLDNVPDLVDVRIKLEILKGFGVKVDFNPESNSLTLVTKSLLFEPLDQINLEIASKIRTSTLLAGALLPRTVQEIVIPVPGGCNLGTRAIDMHLDFLEKMGVEIKWEDKKLKLKKKKSRLIGIRYKFAKISVGATQHLIIAASLAKGETVIENAALEPEVAELGQFLKKMGAKIEGLGTSKITIIGQESLKGCNFTIIADRMEAATYIAMALATKSTISVMGTKGLKFGEFLNTIQASGANIRINENEIQVFESSLEPRSIRTAPFPGFQSDLQPIYAALMCLIAGEFVIEETIFDGRFSYAKEFQKAGIKVEFDGGQKLKIWGQDSSALKGAKFTAHDLRGGISCVILALAIPEVSEIFEVSHIERGYEKLPEKLERLGVNVVVRN